MLMSIMLKKLVYRRKSELKVSWGVCDFMNHFTWSFSYGLCPLVKLLLWVFFRSRSAPVFLDWKGRALSKRGVVYGISVFRTESLCGKLHWWTLPRDGHIFVHTFSVGLKIFCYGWGGESGEIRTCTSCCLRDIKVMKTVKQSSTK